MLLLEVNFIALNFIIILNKIQFRSNSWNRTRCSTKLSDFLIYLLFFISLNKKKRKFGKQCFGIGDFENRKKTWEAENEPMGQVK
jgi:hypothetical protein